MQRRAAVAYVAFFLLVTVGAYGVSSLSNSPPLDAEHELSQNQTVTVNGTTHNVTEVDSAGPSATIEWDAGNETNSTSVSAGENVTLGGTTYVGHVEDETLRLTSNHTAYRQWEAERAEHDELMRRFEVAATMSGITGIVMLALAYLPVRRE